MKKKKTAKDKKEYLIFGERLGIRRLRPTDATPIYLGWLNDFQVQAYTRRRGRNVSSKEMKDFLVAAQRSLDWHLALVVRDGRKHIGNLSLNSIDAKNKSAELSIMIGDRSVWGQGYATEAIELAADFAFRALKLHRLWAESPNSAFNAVMEKIGWIHEGKRRQAFLAGKKFLDFECWSLLHDEWRVRHNRGAVK